MESTLFLIIDDIVIEDLEEDDYTAWEEELGVSDRMVSGRRVEELRGRVWHVELNASAIDFDTMAALNAAFKARRQHTLQFLPDTGSTTLETGVFHLAALPRPTLTRWRGGPPQWSGYALHFEEIDAHDR